jgi:hypothetical protein
MKTASKHVNVEDEFEKADELGEYKVEPSK